MLVAGVATSAQAADLVLLCAGAMRAPVSKMLTGHEVDASYATAGAIRERLARGERPDVVIAPAAEVTRLVVQGLVDPATRRELGATGIGVAVRADAPLPDITTMDALRDTLLAARRVVFVDPAKGSSGQIVLGLFDRLGIADAMKSRTLTIDDGLVGEVVARGEADLGLQQVSEILPVAGVRYVGRLPRESDQTTRYDAAIVASTTHRAEAEALLERLADSATTPLFEASGLRR